MLKRMKLSTKLIGGFIIVAVITLLVGFFGWNGARTLSNDLNNMGEIRLRSIHALLSLSKAQMDVVVGERALVNPMVNTKELRKAQYDYIANSFENADEAWEKYESLLKDEFEEQQWKEFKSQWNEFKNGIENILNIAQEKDNLMEAGIPLNDPKISAIDKRAMTVSEEAREKLLVSMNTINELVAHNEQLSREQLTESAKSSAAVIGITLAGMIIGVIIALTLGIFLSVSITKPLMVAVEDLTSGSGQIASASNQLSATSQQLAEGSAEQASSIEETSSTLEETASMVQQNTENTKQAAILAGQTKSASDKGNDEMREMITAMSELKKSSDEIAKIIKVIDDIAFQTNILALNAAVEAARAGDAGMGFAVVAEEVRNLAQRSAQAAKDTSSMIEGNIELSEKGVDVAKKVEESLGEITTQIKKVNELMDEVAAASQEQTQGIGQINKAIAQMEKVTQQNASGAEESAAAAEELNSQAENMNGIVQQLVKLVEGVTDNASNMYVTLNKIDQRKNLLQANSQFSNKKQHLNHIVKKDEKKTHIVNPDEIIPLEDDTQGF